MEDDHDFLALGERPVDLAHDWSAFANSLPEQYSSPSFNENFAKFFRYIVKMKPGLNEDDSDPINLAELNENQRSIFELVKAHQASAKTNPDGTPPIRLIVQGSAGVFKLIILNF